MLNEFQVQRVWENMLASQTRSLYFAELASRYSRTKQIITGASFFLSSGAAASIIGKLPPWIPLGLATLVALASAYSMAVGLDRKIGTMAKLHSAWNQISADYERLWNHQADDNAEEELEQVVRREKDPSELATTEAPYNPELLGKWQTHVFKMYHLIEEHV